MLHNSIDCDLRVILHAQGVHLRFDAFTGRSRLLKVSVASCAIYADNAQSKDSVYSALHDLFEQLFAGISFDQIKSGSTHRVNVFP